MNDDFDYEYYTKEVRAAILVTLLKNFKIVEHKVSRLYKLHFLYKAKRYLND